MYKDYFVDKVMEMKNKKAIIISISAAIVVVASLFVWNFATKTSQDMSGRNNQSTVLLVELTAEEKIYKELTGNLGEAITASEKEKLQELIKKLVEIENNGNDDDKKSAVYKEIIAILDEVTLRSTAPEDLEKYKKYYNLKEEIAKPKINPTNQYIIKEDGSILYMMFEYMDKAPDVPIPPQINEAWKKTKKIIPLELLKNIKRFIPFKADKEKGGYIAGFMSPMGFGESESDWIIGVAIDAEEKGLPYILIHEYGHYLSLKDINHELDGSYKDIKAENCELLQKFIAECLGHIAEEFDNVDKNKLYLFYARHKNDFVTKYAASNLLEDFAESFARFVAGSEVESEILKKKMNFFNDNQDLSAIKTKILKNIENNNVGEIAPVTE